MCKKYIYKKNLLLCTIAGTLIFSHFGSTHANTQPPEIINEFKLENGEEKTLNNVFIRNGLSAVHASKKAIATITSSTIHSGSFAFAVSQGGRINAKGVKVNALYTGLSISNGIISIEDSFIESKRKSGIIFHSILDIFLKDGEEVINKALLTNTKLFVRDGVGILGPSSSKSVAEVQLRNSEIRADVLLQNNVKKKTDSDPHPVTFVLTADNSIMEGRARTLAVNTTVFNLTNESKWYLNVSQYDINNDFSTFNYALHDIEQRSLSTVSVLNLNNSSIVFNAPHTLAKGQYQTLSVGQTIEVPHSQENRNSATKTVYNATGNAKIYFNTEWSDGLDKAQQKTDRLLVHGDVSGTTTINFNSLSKSETSTAEASIPANMRGLSLIQVSGQADRNSFKLENGYVTMDGSPYKYVLKAYGPTSSLGKAESAQSHLGEVSQQSKDKSAKTDTTPVVLGGMISGVENNIKGESTSNSEQTGNGQNHLREHQNFWDFRLQSATLDDEGKIRALVPQVASYLVMPNALFSAGLADINNQNTLLDTMQETGFETKDHKNKGVFFSTYGNKMTLSSHRTPLQYGYGADIHYAALQAGFTLVALEDKNMTTNFGLLGTYGKLAFTPKDMEGADKSTLDKWSLTAYSGLHHHNGTYVHALLSYGILKGNITTALIGKTAELTNTDTFSASATVGQKFETSTKGLSFEPQAQVVYQRLMLGTLSDIDGFNVDMGNPHQWLVRVGGRLTQKIVPTEDGRILSFYGKLNVIKAFSNNGTIQIGESFHLDTMGAAIEGGFGVNAQLSTNLSLHGDVSYQQKLQKTGISGTSFSGGIRYQF
ncbi:autotransporter outer membrane beta-barrel domain-containing protein [Bartonella krasnovii]|uniref:Autotransporter outer membrane beta-barrel domain-containing protein n=1 Tax=Bartonella krasnovii TaxID=2267275 RepID=A0A5B9D2A3_9HYPH|nr:autotransporter outer membrane beta-barrel domain-containing protein [Bartonella krasnovii]QEE12520.1 autotransporter outer membrane beta-barrel domain-containing protein [Bartonella krasnovii]UNF28710.1 autotransporter outer membrane beta-barrel domain-containing protein [Bartonella krasnovii]UNF35085.1 autotransporter outer membrane beta-barrel domain-containing protein [Bartonella krasnovii]UNF36714.1 autotransporter outer membrane beta-barrel domain-containing protein [Bartonella krasnov